MFQKTSVLFDKTGHFAKAKIHIYILYTHTHTKSDIKYSCHNAVIPCKSGGKSALNAL